MSTPEHVEMLQDALASIRSFFDDQAPEMERVFMAVLTEHKVIKMRQDGHYDIYDTTAEHVLQCAAEAARRFDAGEGRLQ